MDFILSVKRKGVSLSAAWAGGSTVLYKEYELFTLTPF